MKNWFTYLLLIAGGIFAGMQVQKSGGISAMMEKWSVKKQQKSQTEA